MSHDLKNVKVLRDEESWEAEVSAEIPAEALAKYRESTLKEMQKEAKIDGFREGKAPIERIVQIYGEPTILRHAVQHAIEHELPELLAKENVLIVESPRVQTETPENGKPVKFTARAALPPKIDIADYKKIAKKQNATKEDIAVSDEEHKEAMGHLRRERARIDRIESGTEAQKAAEEVKALAEADLPALDDQFVQSLGYENAEKFTEALRGNIKNEKEIQAREKRRAVMLDDLVAGSTIKYPSSLREYELNEMEARLVDDLSRMGMTLDIYLAQVKKTKEQLRTEWKEPADKRAKVRLVLAEIARQEKIEPDAKKLQHEFDHAKKHYPAADADALRAHISHALRNEATLEFLETIA